MKENALAWIVGILNDHQCPYAICGGLAANVYGSPRPLNDIDLFVPAQYFDRIVQAGADYISKPAEHYCEAVEGWDLEYAQFIYQGTKIEIGSDKNVRIFDHSNDEWTALIIDFDNAVKGQLFGIDILVMPKADLVSYKTMLDRDVDRQDVSALN